MKGQLPKKFFRQVASGVFESSCYLPKHTVAVHTVPLILNVKQETVDIKILKVFDLTPPGLTPVSTVVVATPPCIQSLTA